jgi:acyl-CoA synthetase (AMP-forming)/AMP-acid ligase II
VHVRTTTLIDRAALDRIPGGAFLTDGESSCDYRDVPAALAAIETLLERAGVSSGDAVALECSNTVRAALVLLCLLEGRRRCVLCPPADAGRTAPPFCRHVVRVNPPERPDGGLAASGLARGIAVAENPDWNGRGGDGRARLYLHTSGSTSRPRLVVHDRDRLVDNAAGCVARFGLRPGDRVSIPVPIFHMYGLGAAMLPALLAGASIDLQPGAHILRFMARERDFLPTVAFLTPSFCEALLAARKSPRAYRTTVSAGDRLPEDVFRRYEERHGTLLNLYGCTELGAIAACAPDDDLDARMRSAGRLMPGVTLCASRAEDANDARELAFRHDFGFEGYAGDDGEPKRSEDFFPTRDLGRLLAGGYLQVCGRVDHHVNRDGRLVALTDVEAALQNVAGIERAAVVAHGRTRRGAALVAVCLPSAAGAPGVKELRRACLDVLPKHAIPDEFLFVTDLPVLPSGKLDRVAIRARYAPAAADDAAPAGSR